MNKTEILEFINSNPVCRVATVDGDQPRVRTLMMYRADEAGLVFHTGANKDVFRQLNQNPEVEICFNNADSTKQIRVSGTAEIVENDVLKEEILDAHPFLKPLIEEHGLDLLQVFRIVNCVATAWTKETHLEPKEYVKI